MSVKTILATTGRGLARATRGTNELWSVEFLAPDHDVCCLVADPLNPDRLYAGTRGSGVLRSNDAGRTWQSALRSPGCSTLERSPHTYSCRTIEE